MPQPAQHGQPAIKRIDAPDVDRTSVWAISRLRRTWPIPMVSCEYNAMRLGEAYGWSIISNSAGPGCRSPFANVPFTVSLRSRANTAAMSCGGELFQLSPPHALWLASLSGEFRAHRGSRAADFLQCRRGH